MIQGATNQVDFKRCTCHRFGHCFVGIKFTSGALETCDRVSAVTDALPDMIQTALARAKRFGQEVRMNNPNCCMGKSLTGDGLTLVLGKVNP
jgi:hypothetical protein